MIKGIYPVETVYSTVSVTATLSEKKLLDCCEEFQSIPKKNYHFSVEKYVGEEHYLAPQKVYENIFPYNVVFAYKGEIGEWNDLLLEFLIKSNGDHSLLPDLIIVNKVGYVEKVLEKSDVADVKFVYHSFKYEGDDNYGLPFSKMLYHLYNLSGEQELLKPDYTEYFNQDL